ncbi:hypothetical protein, partial [Georgenia sp.]
MFARARPAGFGSRAGSVPCEGGIFGSPTGPVRFEAGTFGSRAGSVLREADAFLSTVAPGSAAAGSA